jgi:hypothetical protein
MKLPMMNNTTAAKIKVEKRSSAQECDATMMNNATKAGIKIIFLLLIACCVLPASSTAQVNAVEFGKNRVQFKKFKWYYYQTKNFNVYYYQNGEELAKFIAQSAEKELSQMEVAAEYSYKDGLTSFCIMNMPT